MEEGGKDGKGDKGGKGEKNGKGEAGWYAGERGGGVLEGYRGVRRVKGGSDKHYLLFDGIRWESHGKFHPPPELVAVGFHNVRRGRRGSSGREGGSPSRTAFSGLIQSNFETLTNPRKQSDVRTIIIDEMKMYLHTASDTAPRPPPLFRLLKFLALFTGLFLFFTFFCFFVLFFPVISARQMSVGKHPRRTLLAVN